MKIDSDMALVNNISFKSDLLTKPVDDSTKGAFDKVYQAALDLYNETNKYQKVADDLQIDFAVGKTDDIAAIMVAQEKAYTSLNFTVQVTNKVVEAYREIMRIQL